MSRQGHPTRQTRSIPFRKRWLSAEGRAQRPRFDGSKGPTVPQSSSDKCAPYDRSQKSSLGLETDAFGDPFRQHGLAKSGIKRDSRIQAVRELNPMHGYNKRVRCNDQVSGLR